MLYLLLFDRSSLLLYLFDRSSRRASMAWQSLRLGLWVDYGLRLCACSLWFIVCCTYFCCCLSFVVPLHGPRPFLCCFAQLSWPVGGLGGVPLVRVCCCCCSPLIPTQCVSQACVFKYGRLLSVHPQEGLMSAATPVLSPELS